MPASLEVLTALLLIFAAAKAAGELALRLRQPAVIGELLVGIVLGPSALGLVGRPGVGILAAFHGEQAAAEEGLRLALESIAELGVVLLLFYVGLETRLRDLLAVGWRAALVGTLGVLLPLFGGIALMLALGEPEIESLFIGVALVATSVGITARVLRDLGLLGLPEARIILGAAVLDDILGLLLLTIVSGLGETGHVEVTQVLGIATRALLFTVVVAGVGTWAIPRWFSLVEQLRMSEAPLVIALILMLGLAVFAAQLGLAAIIGAFLAGLALADVAEDYDLERQALPLYTLLVPIFFVMTGLRVDLKAFAQPATLGLALLVTAVALVTKAVGAGLGAFGRGWRSMAVVGVGMVPRGEVGLIVATIGLAEGVVEQRLYGVVVAMSILTTLLAPPVLHWLLGPIVRTRTLQSAEVSTMTSRGEGVSHHDTAGED